MKRSVLLVVLAVIAALVALAYFVSRNRASSDGARSSAIASGPAAPVTDVDSSAALTSDAQSIELADVGSTERSSRAPLVGGTFRSATRTSSTTGVVRGRVRVAAGHSPKGLVVRLRLAIPAVDPLVLGDDGAFEFANLNARTYELDASGLDDVVWRAERYRIQLERGQVLDVDWDLSDRCPAIVDAQVSFDGLPAACSIEPWGTGEPRAPLLVSDKSGRVCLRALGSSDKLSAFVSNAVNRADPPAVLRVGRPTDFTVLDPCTRKSLALDVRTALVRVLASEDGSPPNAAESEPTSCSVYGHRDAGETPSGPESEYWLGKLELNTGNATLATFRAGPGSYSLSSMTVDAVWSANVVVTQPGEVVDCRLVRR